MASQRQMLEFKDPLSKPSTQEYKKSLRRWNLAVGAVHTTSFVVLLIITLSTLSRTLRLPLWTDFGASIAPLGLFPLAATLLPFPAITAIFHFAQAFGVCDYYQYALVRGVTPHRWLEYSITNGLMTFSVFVLAGAGNILLPLTGLVLNVVMQLFGYFHERANSTHQHSLGFLFYGFLPWLPLWFIPLAYYIAAATSLPIFYGVAIIGTFLGSIAFTFPLFWRYWTSDEPIEANYKAERAFLLLSLTLKLFLDWTVVIGNLVETA